jgi:Flp pilus assembly pilin Flp
MNLVIWKIRFALRALLAGEEGQDLVEYSMIVALMALGAAAGMNSVGTAIVNICGQLSAVLYIALG